MTRLDVVYASALCQGHAAASLFIFAQTLSPPLSSPSVYTEMGCMDMGVNYCNNRLSRHGLSQVSLRRCDVIRRWRPLMTRTPEIANRGGT